MNPVHPAIPAVILILLAFGLSAAMPEKPVHGDSSCVRCHTDADRLVSLAGKSPGTEDASSCGTDPGEG